MTTCDAIEIETPIRAAASTLELLLFLVMQASP